MAERPAGDGAAGSDAPGAAPPSEPRPPGQERHHRTERICLHCGQRISGQFVKTARGCYHLDCFRCADCKQIVASKFFTLDPTVASPGAAPRAAPHPLILCERDHFRRLDLLCYKCEQPLRGPHIKALNHKYHLECFSCSVCPKTFGVNDTYYERDGHVYCAYHFGLYFASLCGGCGAPVLGNFVEVTRRSKSRGDAADVGESAEPPAPAATAGDGRRTDCWHPECYMIYKLWSVRLLSSRHVLPPPPPVPQLQSGALLAAGEVETLEGMAVYRKACRIFEVLSAFEESSAECMTEMLMHFSNQQYSSGVIQASKFIAHIDVLFAAIDHIEHELQRRGDRSGLNHTKEPKQLAKKIVFFFSLLTHTRESVHTPRGEITKDLISLVTGLAHTHKVLIRIALNGALRLERQFDSQSTIYAFLNRLLSLGTTTPALPTRIQISDIKTDLCPVCRRSVEDACVKYAHNTLRWHWGCFQCKSCARPLRDAVGEAVCDGVAIYCAECASARAGLVEGAVSRVTGFSISRDFERVTQLEQYVFLLRCALKRLCGLLGVRFEDWPQGPDMLVSQRIRNIALHGPVGPGGPTGASGLASGALPLPLVAGAPSAVAAQSVVAGAPLAPGPMPLGPAGVVQSSSTPATALLDSTRSIRVPTEPAVIPTRAAAAEAESAELSNRLFGHHRGATSGSAGSLRPSSGRASLDDSALGESGDLASELARLSPHVPTPSWEALNIEQGPMTAAGRRQGRSSFHHHHHLHQPHAASEFAYGELMRTRSDRDADRASIASVPSVRSRAKSFSGSFVHRRLSVREGGGSSSSTPAAVAADASLGAALEGSLGGPRTSSEREAGEGEEEEDEEDDDDEEEEDDEPDTMISPLHFASDAANHRRSAATFPGITFRRTGEGAHGHLGSASGLSATSLSSSAEDRGPTLAGGLPAPVAPPTPPPRHLAISGGSEADGAEGSPSGTMFPAIETAAEPLEPREPPLPLEPSPAQLRSMSHSTSGDGLAAAGTPTSVPAPARKGSAPGLASETRFMSELSALESFVVRQIAVIALHPLVADYFSLNDLMELIEMRKMTIWEKMVASLKGGKKSGRPRAEGTFGVPLELLVEHHGANTDLALSPGQVRIPLCVDVCVQALYRGDLRAEGVFRKNGNIRRLKQMAAMMDNDPSLRTVQWSLTKDNSVQLAALLKKFLRDLPEPLLTFKLHELFCVSQKLPAPAQRKECLHLLLCLLPRPNRDLLEIVLLLLQEVARLKDANRMNLDNLATVMAPNLLYSKGKSAVDGHSPLAIGAVRDLLEHGQDMLQVPREVWERMKQQGVTGDAVNVLNAAAAVSTGGAPHARPGVPSGLAGPQAPLGPPAAQPPAESHMHHTAGELLGPAQIAMAAATPGIATAVARHGTLASAGPPSGLGPGVGRHAHHQHAFHARLARASASQLSPAFLQSQPVVQLSTNSPTSPNLALAVPQQSEAAATGTSLGALAARHPYLQHHSQPSSPHPSGAVPIPGGSAGPASPEQPDGLVAPMGASPGSSSSLPRG